MTLKDYCDEKHISMYELGIITNVSPSHLYAIDRGVKRNITLDTIEKIFEGTKKKFKVGLRPNDYLNKISKDLWKTNNQ